MKTLLTIYIVAWSILLFVFLVTWPIKFIRYIWRYTPWYVYLAGTVIAPIAVPVLFYYLFQILLYLLPFGVEGHPRRIEYAWESSEDGPEREEKAEKSFREAVALTQNQCTGRFIKSAHSLHRRMRIRRYNKIPKTLHITVPNGYTFFVSPPDSEGLGGESLLCCKTPTLETEYNIFNVIRFEQSGYGAWSAYLLLQLWHSLPLEWHANYAKRDYLFSTSDLHLIRHDSIDSVKPSIPHFKKKDIHPEIYENGGKYYISCCYWSDFGGVFREHAEITLDNGKLVDFVLFSEETLYSYHCGIMY